MPQQPQSRSAFDIGATPGNFKGWQDMALGICMLVALTVMVFMRRRIGLRKLRKGYLFGMAFAMVAVNWIGNLRFSLFGGIGSNGNVALRNYAFLFLAVGLWEHYERWQELRRGELAESTRSHGVTWFDFLPMREDRLYLIVDPLVTFLAGALLRYRLGFGLLGLWIMLAAIAFRFVEKAVHERSIDRDLDILDGFIEARGGAAIMQHFQQAKAPVATGETTGLDTGADAHLTALIAKRKEQETDRGMNHDAG